MSEAFPGGEGVWLRCQLHCHTTNSDGDASPGALCDHYAAAGFDAIAITDHWHVTTPERDDLVVVPASELSCHAPSPQGEAEALALGVPRLPEPREPFGGIEQMAAWIAAAGGVAYLCHPYWSGLTAVDLLAAPSLTGVEVWNGSSQAQQGNGLSAVHWDGALQEGRMLLGVATDDCHSPGQDSLLGWTWVFARERTAAGIVAALRRGDAYASSGPRLLAVEIGGDRVTVRCSPARAVRLRSGAWDGCAVMAGDGAGDYRGTTAATDDAGLVIAARFELPEYWNWARVEVEDAHGRTAWSNPFGLTSPAGG